MDDAYKASKIDDLPQIWDGFAKLVREGLDITAFGAQIMDLPPDYETKSHNESSSGQEELYVALRGSGAVVMGDGERATLDPDNVVAVAPQTDRTLTSGPDGLRVLCIGSTPGKGYEPPEWTQG
jgi:mannose-6-phosphate isomerase-like protein (cupin superfamily)